MPDKGRTSKSVEDAERRAIAKLIKQVDDADKIRTQVPRRIWLLFAIVIALGMCLLIFAVRFGRRDRPVTPRRP